MANTNTFFKPIKTHYDTFTVVLCNRDHTRIGTIKNIDLSSVHIKSEMTNGNEVQFDVYNELDGVAESLWDNIVDFKLIYIPELDDYLEITITDYDSVERKKSVVGVNAGIAELSQTQLYNLEINTQADVLNKDNEDSEEPTIFYNENNPKKSLLNRVLYKVPQYSIGHVPVSVAAMQRTFSVTNKSVWDFLSKDVAEEFNVLFVINNVDKTINVYDLLVVCNSCQKRQQPHYEYGYYEEIAYTSDANMNIVTDSDNAWLYGNDSIVAYKKLTCEECGSTDLDFFGEDTHVLVDKDNLTDEIQLTIDTDAVKNTFKLEAGDDDMTAAIIAINPNGSEYINMFNELDYADMPASLVEKLNQYNALYESYKPEYAELMQNYYEAIDNILKYTSALMPDQPHDPITPQGEAAKLTVENLSPASLVAVGAGTTVASVNGSLVQLAKTLVKTGYVKVEVDMKEIPATFTYQGVDANNHHYGLWNGRFLITSYSDSEQTAYSSRITVVVNDDYETYLNQKIAKNIVRYDDKEDGIYEVLKISDQLQFENALTYYCVNRLESFKESLSNCLNILTQEGHGQLILGQDPDTGSDVVDEFYQDIYVPYYNKLQAVEKELPRRQSGIEQDGTPCTRTDGYGNPYSTANVDYWTNILGIITEKDENGENKKTILPGSLEARKEEIQDILNLENYLGDDNYKIYCAYRREDAYSNSHYISTDLDTVGLFNNAKQFLEAANEELLKASTPQYSVKCDLFNLLPTNGYEYFKDKFVLGNWIRVIADNQLFRLRLLTCSIDFDKPDTINVEFSNVTKIGNIMTDVESILKSAKSMSSSYGATMKQAEAGKEADKEIGAFVKEGLLSALTNVKNNNDEEITFGKFGIYAKSYDPDTETYSPEQLRITHNILVFTKDNWQTSSAALGKHNFRYYDANTDSYKTGTEYGLTAEFVQAGYVNGSSIIGGNIYSENYSPTNNTGSHINLNDGTFSFGGDKLTYSNNRLVLKNGSIEATNITNGNNFFVNAEGNMQCNNATINGAVSSGGTISGTEIIGGTIKVPSAQGAKFEVDENGTMTCTGANINGHITNGSGFEVTETGILTAKSGTIGGWNINDGYLSGNNVTLNGSGNIRCTIGGETKWGIYNDGHATFSDITATGGNFTNVTISGYATIEEMNLMNLAIQGQLTAVSANIGDLTAQKASIDDLTTGVLEVRDSLNAKNLDVSGTVGVAQLTAGTIQGHSCGWTSATVTWLQHTPTQSIYNSTTGDWKFSAKDGWGGTTGDTHGFVGHSRTIFFLGNNDIT